MWAPQIQVECRSQEKWKHLPTMVLHITGLGCPDNRPTMFQWCHVAFFSAHHSIFFSFLPDAYWPQHVLSRAKEAHQQMGHQFYLMHTLGWWILRPRYDIIKLFRSIGKLGPGINGQIQDIEEIHWFGEKCLCPKRKSTGMKGRLIATRWQQL